MGNTVLIRVFESSGYLRCRISQFDGEEHGRWMLAAVQRDDFPARIRIRNYKVADGTRPGILTSDLIEGDFIRIASSRQRKHVVRAAVPHHVEHVTGVDCSSISLRITRGQR